MKSILAIALSIIMAFLLCACSSENKNISEPSDTNSKNGDKTVTINLNDNNNTVSANSNNTINPTNSSTANDSTIINLNNYVSVDYEGYNFAGYGSVKFDDEAFLLDHINNVSYNQENLAVYKELYGNTDDSAAKNILNYISVRLENRINLGNGDAVKLVWNINTDKVNTYFKWNYTCSAQTFTVTGLEEAPTFDPFERLGVQFSGTAPYGKVSVSNYRHNYGGQYNVTPSENLKNGDKVKVTFTCADKRIMVARYNTYPSSFEKTYTVSGLNTYVQSIKDLSNEQLDKLISQAKSEVWVLGYGYYKDAKYYGSYFYEPNNDRNNSIYFVFEHPERKGNINNVYTAILLSNLIINEKGELVYKVGSEYGNTTYKSKEELNNAFKSALFQSAE